MNELFMVKPFSASFNSTSSNFYEGDLSVETDGYTALGVVGYNSNNSVNYFLSRYYLRYTNAINFIVRSMNNALSAGSITFYVLFAKKQS